MLFVLIGFGFAVVFFAIKSEEGTSHPSAGGARPSALGLLPAGSKPTGPSLAEALRAITISKKKEMLRAVLAQMAATDPLGALERIREQIDDYNLRIFAYRALFDAWMAIDHREAARHIDRSTEPGACAHVVASKWPLDDLDAAWEWMLERSTFPDGMSNLSVIVTRAIRDDTVLTTARINAIEDPEIRAQASQSATYNWPHDQNEAAEEWAMGLPTDQLRDSALSGLLVRFHHYTEDADGRWDIETAKRLILGVSSAKRTKSIRSMMQTLERERGAEQAMNWLLEFEEVLDPTTFASNFVGIWSGSEDARLPEPATFAEYGAPLQKAIARGLSSVRRPIDEKLAWLDTVDDEALQIESVQVIAQFNYGEGRAAVAKAVEEWALESESPEIRERALLALVESANELRDCQESLRLAALISEPELRHKKIERAPATKKVNAERILAEGRTALRALDLPDEISLSLEEKYLAGSR